MSCNTLDVASSNVACDCQANVPSHLLLGFRIPKPPRLRTWGPKVRRAFTSSSIDDRMRILNVPVTLRWISTLPFGLTGFGTLGLGCSGGAPHQMIGHDCTGQTALRRILRMLCLLSRRVFSNVLPRSHGSVRDWNHRPHMRMSCDDVDNRNPVRHE